MINFEIFEMGFRGFRASLNWPMLSLGAFLRRKAAGGFRAFGVAGQGAERFWRCSGLWRRLCAGAVAGMAALIWDAGWRLAFRLARIVRGTKNAPADQAEALGPHNQGLRVRACGAMRIRARPACI